MTELLPTLRLRAKNRQRPLNQLAISENGKLIYGPTCPELFVPYEYPTVNYRWYVELFGNFLFGPATPYSDSGIPTPWGDNYTLDGDFLNVTRASGDAYYNIPDFLPFGLADVEYYDVHYYGSISPPNGARVPVVTDVYRNGSHFNEDTFLTMKYSNDRPARRFWIDFSFTSHSAIPDSGAPLSTFSAYFKTHARERPGFREHYNWSFFIRATDSSVTQLLPDYTVSDSGEYNLVGTYIHFSLDIHYSDFFIPVLNEYVSVPDHAEMTTTNPLFVSGFHIIDEPGVVRGKLPLYHILSRY